MIKRILKVALRLISWTVVGALVLVTAFNLASYVKRATGDEQMPLVFGYGTAIVLTGSMEPEISAGDLVVIKEKDSYEEGDVITYEGRTTPVTHRIIEISRDGDGNALYLTQGDANNTDDGYIPNERVVGKVVLTVPSVGALQQFFTTPIGFLVITLIVGALLFMPELLGKKRNDGSEKQGEPTDAKRSNKKEETEE